MGASWYSTNEFQSVCVASIHVCQHQPYGSFSVISYSDWTASGDVEIIQLQIQVEVFLHLYYLTLTATTESSDISTYQLLN